MNITEPVASKTLFEVTQAMQARQREPLQTLRQAIERLQLARPSQLDMLEAENPHLLRDRSVELVKRGVLMQDELSRALALVAGLVEVDVVHFEVEVSERGAYLPIHECRELCVVPLGMANEMLFVASFNPTSDELHRTLCQLTGHTVSLVWAPREDIEMRLNKGPEVPVLKWEVTGLPPKAN